MTTFPFDPNDALDYSIDDNGVLTLNNEESAWEYLYEFLDEVRCVSKVSYISFGRIESEEESFGKLMVEFATHSRFTLKLFKSVWTGRQWDARHTHNLIVRDFSKPEDDEYDFRWFVQSAHLPTISDDLKDWLE